MINATTATAANAATAPTTTASEKLKESYDSFLTLLTAQIANQDPLNPVDSTQFVSQLAQLSMVEQGIMTNTNLENISANLAGLGEMADLQLLGRDVLVASDSAAIKDGKFSYSYQVDEGATDVRARILAQDGSLIRDLDGLSTKADKVQDLGWDMITEEGLQVFGGTFKIELSATDAQGAAVPITGLTRVGVDKVEFGADGSQITLANGEVVLADVVRSVY